MHKSDVAATWLPAAPTGRLDEAGRQLRAERSSLSLIRTAAGYQVRERDNEQFTTLS